MAASNWGYPADNSAEATSYTRFLFCAFFPYDPKLMRYAQTLMLAAAMAFLGTAKPGFAAAPPAVVQAWDDVDRWLARSASGDDWRKFLKIGDLQQQIGSASADPAAVAATLNRLRSEAPGLSDARFVALENALAAWLPAISGQASGGDLPTLARAAASSFDPVSSQELTWLRQAAAAAQARLGAFLAYNPHREAWDRSLAWNQLSGQLDVTAQPNA